MFQYPLFKLSGLLNFGREFLFGWVDFFFEVQAKLFFCDFVLMNQQGKEARYNNF